MSYKISTFILAILLAASVAYNFVGQEQEKLYFETINREKGADSVSRIEVTKETVAQLNKELKEFNDFAHFDEQDVIDKWANATLDSAKGARFTPFEAGEKMKKFNKWNERTGNLIRKIVPFGFALGKQRLREMVREIDSINRSAKGDVSKMIFGVRINLSIGKDPKARRGNMDVMIIPVKHDGKSYFDFRTATFGSDSSATLIDTSSPCPNMCN